MGEQVRRISEKENEKGLQKKLKQKHSKVQEK